MSTNNFTKPWHGIPQQEIPWYPTVMAGLPTHSTS